ncbi:MAG: hypothetical protein ABL949_11960 [Fimbriimonadaceae bacterium]
MTPESLNRIEIARRVSDAHLAIPTYRAGFITGSAAEGIADEVSDIDMGLFFETFPGRDDLVKVRESLDPNPPKWELGSYEDEEVLYSIRIDDIEVQYGINTVAAGQGYADKICRGEMGTSPEIKIAIGTLFCIAFHGEELINGWREQFKHYPESYRVEAMKKFLKLRPLDDLIPKIVGRNAEIWIRRDLMERVYQMCAALGALNHIWFSEFQFKRSDSWCAKLTICPPDFGARCKSVATLELERAIPIALELDQETRALVS